MGFGMIIFKYRRFYPFNCVFLNNTQYSILFKSTHAGFYAISVKNPTGVAPDTGSVRAPAPPLHFG